MILPAQAANQWGVHPEQTGVWLACLAGVLGVVFLLAAIINQGRQLFKRNVDPDKEFVTRAELRGAINELEKRLESTRSEMVGSIKELQQYSQTRFHDISNSTNGVALKMERMLTLYEQKLRDESRAKV